MLLQYFKDSHVHTVISHDGKSAINEYLAEASNKGVDEITFTEHYDIYDGVKTNLTTLDVAEYHKKYLALTKGAAIQTNFGIEIGLRPEAERKIKWMMSRNKFDEVIASSHIVCGKDMAKDPSFFEGLTRQEACMRYYNETLENIYTFDDFDVYGHLDHIKRYGNYKESDSIDTYEIKQIQDKILRALIHRDKGIEVNSSGIRYGIGSPHPDMDIVQRYVELGGKIITLGSDAHSAKDLAAHFAVVLLLLKRRGIERIAVFRKREPHFYEI